MIPDPNNIPHEAIEQDSKERKHTSSTSYQSSPEINIFGLKIKFEDRDTVFLLIGIILGIIIGVGIIKQYGG